MSTRTEKPSRHDPDGIRVSARRWSDAVRPWMVVVLAVVVAVVVYVATRPPARSVSAPPRTPGGVAPAVAASQRPVKVLPQVYAAAPAPVGAAPRAEPARAPARETVRPTPASVPNARQAARAAEGEQGMISELMRDVAEGLRMNGGSEGIGVYPPKGTDPPKPGIIVPDDFQLPEGYVRYHQVTDDGRRLPPILMFSPDYDFVDADGKPIAVPQNGIVPPEMAPPGLPARILEIPGEPAGAAR